MPPRRPTGCRQLDDRGGAVSARPTAAGRVLKAFAPRGLDAGRQAAPALEDAVREGSAAIKPSDRIGDQAMTPRTQRASSTIWWRNRDDRPSARSTAAARSMPSRDPDDDDPPRLECGVFGVFGVRGRRRHRRPRPARPAASRPGSLRHRRLRRPALPHRAPHGPRRRRLHRRRPGPAPARRDAPSATPATPPPAAAASATSSRCSPISRPAAWPSPTTAT